MTNKTYVFPLDKSKFNSKPAMYDYIEENYPNMVSTDMPPSRLYFNLKYKKTAGKCVMTGKPTVWNNTTERYERFFDEKARQDYREMFKRRMLSKFGKYHILDDPEQQKKMLNKRAISIDYKWNNGEITVVNSKLEEKFLLFLETTYGFTKSCLTEAPTIYYKLDNGTSSFYLPDFFIPSLNLIVEIKGSNPHYQERDSHKEVLKAKYTGGEGFNFVQINDENYLTFNAFFLKTVIQN